MDSPAKMYRTLLAACIVLVCEQQAGCKRTTAPDRPSDKVADTAAASIPAEKIADIDPTRWKLDRCERHGVLLTEAIVPFRIGNDRIRDREYLVAWVELFPHAEDPYLDDGFPPRKETHVRVRHCAKCMEVKAEWLKSHPDIDECGVPRRTSR
jgi:hypothetical protein